MAFIPSDSFQKDLISQKTKEIYGRQDVIDFVGVSVSDRKIKDAFNNFKKNELPQLIKYEYVPKGVLTQHGLYIIGKVLGKGGYSKVYQAIFHPFVSGVWSGSVHLAPNAPHKNLAMSFTEKETQYVSIKNIYDQLSEETKSYVCPVYEIGQSGNDYWMVTERCVTTLENINFFNDPNPIQLFKRVMIELKEGLRLLHCDGVVHRDIKPANVFLTADYRVQIGDLGGARKEGRISLPSGTPGYTAITFAPREGERTVYVYEKRWCIVQKREDVCSYGITLRRLIKNFFDHFHAIQGCQSEENRYAYQMARKQLTDKVYEGDFQPDQLEKLFQRNKSLCSGYKKRKNGKPSQVFISPPIATVRGALQKIQQLFSGSFSVDDMATLKRLCDLMCDLSGETHSSYPVNFDWDFNTWRLAAVKREQEPPCMLHERSETSEPSSSKKRRLNPPPQRDPFDISQFLHPTSE